MDDLKAKLLAPGLEEADVEIPGVGTVRVRALNRLEAIKVQTAKNIAAGERLIVSLGMLSPRMTEVEVGRWQKNSRADQIGRVSDKIAELSGMLDGSAKEVVREFLANPEAEFRDVPRGEAVDDADAAADGDE